MKSLFRLFFAILLAVAGVLAEGVTRQNPEPFVFNPEKLWYPMTGTPKNVTGTMKIPVILIEFEDDKFSEGHDSLYFDKFLNKENYSEGHFHGSVRDYFMDQSNGKLDLSFDILGTVTMQGVRGDYIASQFVARKFSEELHDVVLSFDEKVDFGKYDWNGDKYLDPVGFIIPGPLVGETQNFEDLFLDGMQGSNFIVVSEKIKADTSSGFGIFCHELSHSFGLPDLYVSNSIGVLDYFDLMDFGNYNDYGYTPTGYSAYEKWLMGWLTPIELTESVSVNELIPLSEGGDAYWIINPNNENEAFFFENRQKQGWDKFIPQSGLMVSHLNYDPLLRYNIKPNQQYKNLKTGFYYVQANGSDSAADLGALYPYSLLSEPSWTWAVALGSVGPYVNGSILDIRQNDDGTMNFRFEVRDNANVWPDEFDVVVDDVFYHVNRSMHVAQVVQNRGGVYSGAIVIPSAIFINDDSLNVNSIGDAAFYDASVTSVTLPESITEIGECAFFNTAQLQSLNFPRSLRSIKERAFVSSSLPEAVLPEGLDSTAARVFVLSSVSRVVWPSSAKVIPWSMFEGSRLKEITLNEGLEKIEPYAFSETEMEEIVLPASLDTLEFFSLYSKKLKTIVAKSPIPIPLDIYIDDSSWCTAFGYSDDAKEMTLRVPKGSLAAYKEADGWNWFGTIEEYDTEEQTTVIAKKVPRYNIQLNARSFDMKGRLIQDRTKRRGFFVKR